MKKIISIRITDEEERRITELKKRYKDLWPFEVEYSTTDIIRAAINTLYYQKIKSNK